MGGHSLLSRLEGVYAKVERAHSQLRSLESDLGKYCDQQRLMIVHRRESDRQIWVFVGETPRVPVEFSVRIGEIVHNLRSALNHLVWQLVIANGETTDRRNEYPIFREEHRYENESKRKLRGVEPHGKSMIRSYQPYQVHGGIGSQLWLLHVMSTNDKHRHLNITTAIANGMNALVVSDSDGEERTPAGGRTFVGALREDKQLAELDNPDLEISANFVIEVRFSHSDTRQPGRGDLFLPNPRAQLEAIEKYGPAGRPVIGTIKMCLHDVVSIVRLPWG